jgi:hypothetical protein
MEYDVKMEDSAPRKDDRKRNKKDDDDHETDRYNNNPGSECREIEVACGAKGSIRRSIRSIPFGTPGA